MMTTTTTITITTIMIINNAAAMTPAPTTARVGATAAVPAPGRRLARDKVHPAPLPVADRRP